MTEGIKVEGPEKNNNKSKDSLKGVKVESSETTKNLKYKTLKSLSFHVFILTSQVDESDSAIVKMI